MAKKIKKIIINLLLVCVYVISLYLLGWYQDNYIDVDIVQKGVFIILLCTSALIIYINNKNRTQLKDSKWLWIIFEIIGVIGATYSLIALLLIFAFRRGIGF